MSEVPIIADERDLMQSALHAMRDAFVEACQLVPDWSKQGEFQHRFFDGYQEAKRIWGVALVKRDVVDRPQEELS
jgi:hypothetical protein